MANDWTSKAAEEEKRKAESIDRSDTDGFVSQWAHGVTAEKYRLQAEIEAQGGRYDFPTIFDLATDQEVANRVISTRFGTCYALVDDSGRFIGVFVPWSFTARSKWSKLYRLGTVSAPAVAELGGSGHGLSGAASVHAYAKRIYPAAK